MVTKNELRVVKVKYCDICGKEFGNGYLYIDGLVLDQAELYKCGYKCEKCLCDVCEDCVIEDTSNGWTFKCPKCTKKTA